jgi:hypothetical protein
MPKEAWRPLAEEAVIGDGEAVAVGAVTFFGALTVPVEYETELATDLTEEGATVTVE